MGKGAGISIRERLTFTLMLVSTIAVLVAGSGYIISQRALLCRDMIDGLQGVARITGWNCARALALDDMNGAERVLSSLQAKPSIAFARLYRSENDLFAVYRRDANVAPLPPHGAFESGHRFESGYLWVTHVIMRGDAAIGFLCIADDMTPARRAMQTNAIVTCAVVLIALALAYALSTRLARVLSVPILSLADTAHSVSESKDYSVRAQPVRGREMRILTQAMNEMLDTIQDRESDLHDANKSLAEEVAVRRRAEEKLRQHGDELERTVAERTAELQATNRQLTVTLVKLERSNRELRKFAEIAAHDLQEPLRKITAFADRVQRHRGKGLPEPIEKDLDRIVGSTRRMRALLNDLLSLSQVAQRPREFSPVALGHVMDNVLAEHCAEIATAGANVEVGPLPTIEGDRRELFTLMSHLVENALKFRRSDVQPIVKVYTVNGDQPDPASGVDGSKDIVRIAVEDNGVGFDQKYGKRIFEVFKRLHGYDAYPGTGIGLAICERVVLRHGGSIAARGRAGEGAVFVLTFPRCKAKEEA